MSITGVLQGPVDGRGRGTAQRYDTKRSHGSGAGSAAGHRGGSEGQATTETTAAAEGATSSASEAMAPGGGERAKAAEMEDQARSLLVWLLYL